MFAHFYGYHGRLSQPYAKKYTNEHKKYSSEYKIARSQRYFGDQ
jgi:hypothetical protein